jgi:DNA-binding winged helix-turn-helix (wHTH) protein
MRKGCLLVGGEAARQGRMDAGMNPAREIRFDGWTLRRATGELLRGGSRTRLQHRPLVLLEALLERPGELVTREELIARLWPRGVVDFETALNTAVRRLRTALDDHAEAPRYIETIPRRGYRFIGALDPVGPADPESQVSGAAPPVATGNSAAWRPVVLLTATLAVAAIAGALATGVRMGGSPRETPSVPMEQALPASEAEDTIRLADHFYQRRGPGDLARAKRLYERTLARQPDHAAAWAGLAGVYWIETVEGQVDPEVGLSKLRDAAERALALDPGLAHAHLRLSQYRSALGDRAESAWHARMAAALDPGDPLVVAFAASHAAADGRLDEALALQRRALELEPLSHVTRYNLAWYLLMAGRIEDASGELDALLELGMGDDARGEALAIVRVMEGRAPEALGFARALPAGRERWQMMAIVHHALGDAAESEAALQSLIRCCGTEDPLRVAEVYAFRGEADASFTWLQHGTALDGRPPWIAGSRREPWMAAYSPLLVSLHDDPRWARWVAAVQPTPSADRTASRR